MKKIMKIVISLAIIFSTVHFGMNETFALSSSAEKMVVIALKETGSGYKKKYGASPWCASFISWAARSAGVSTNSIPSASSSSGMYYSVKNNGGKVVSSPQRGDLVFYKNKNGSICHVAIMTSSTMSIHGNYSRKVSHIAANNYYDSNGVKTNRSRMIFVRPNYGSSDAVSNDKVENSTSTNKNNVTTNKNNVTTNKNNMATAVKKTSVTKLTIKGYDNKVEYTSKPIKPAITVYNGNKKVDSSNYTVTYGKNTEPGKGSITIKGKGECTGTVTKTFTILETDYTKLNKAKSLVPADLSIYTDESVSVLNNELDKVKSLKKNSIQSTIDKTTLSLNNAINGLIVKSADYTCVENAKALVPADLSDYTSNSVEVLNKALSSVEEGKLITEQSAVNDMALAIETAVNNLEVNYFRQEIILPIVAVLGLGIIGIVYKKKKTVKVETNEG